MGVSIVSKLLEGYLYSVIAISWHRLVILGKDNYKPMSIFKPKFYEVQFILLLVLLNSIQLLALLSPFIPVNFFIVMPILMITTVVIGMFLFFKLSFCFPAKAVNRPMSFKKSFSLTRGYFLKIFFTSIRAMALIGVLFSVYMVFSIYISSYSTSKGDTISIILYPFFAISFLFLVLAAIV